MWLKIQVCCKSSYSGPLILIPDSCRKTKHSAQIKKSKMHLKATKINQKPFKWHIGKMLTWCTCTRACQYLFCMKFSWKCWTNNHISHSKCCKSSQGKATQCSPYSHHVLIIMASTKWPWTNNIQVGILPNAQCHLDFIVVNCDLR